MSKKGASPRQSWLDDKDTPMIEHYAKQLDSFVNAMADGTIEAQELKDQEKNLVQLLKEVEPMLSDEQHEKVTRLICELTAYDIMQMLHTIQSMRPPTGSAAWRP